MRKHWTGDVISQISLMLGLLALFASTGSVEEATTRARNSVAKDGDRRAFLVRMIVR